MKKINVLIIGSGGREHALAWKLIRSPQAGTIYVAPGNTGTAMLGCQNIPIAPTHENFRLLSEIAVGLEIKLVVVGPETSLAEYITRAFGNRGIPVFGPSGDATRIEWSKCFAKELMWRCQIPTAAFETFSNPLDALKYAARKDGNVVIKADGLAAGKGVRPCRNIMEAETAIDDLMVKKVLGEENKNLFQTTPPGIPKLFHF